MHRRKISNLAEAQACLDAVQGSGLSRREWALQNGVDGRSLNAWRINIDRSRCENSLPQLVELVTEKAPASSLRIWCGRFLVEVSRDVDAELLQRVLGVVASC